MTRKKVRFESWKFPDRADGAREIVESMLKMGSPIVEQGGVMSRLKYDELGIRAQPMSKDNLLSEIHLTVDYLIQKWEKAVDHEGKTMLDSEQKPIKRLYVEVGDVHRHLINTIFGMPWPENKLWKLRGVMTHPIINKSGGYAVRNGLYWEDQMVNGVKTKIPKIHLADGYDPVSQYFFAVPDRVREGLAGIEDQRPATAEIVDALDCIDEFLCDFSFATPSAKASAIAFMLTMVCREIIEGSVPMLEVRAPESQSGKSLLVKMMIEAVTGERPSLFSPNFRDVSEFEKELLSQLLRGRNYVFMDNVYGKVQSSYLDMALTAGHVDKRLLGMNIIATVYSGMPFVMTANNPTLSEDMKNRIYLLDILKPKESKKFFHTKPEAYALENGPRLLRALFTLYNHWDKNEGRMPFTKRRIDGFIEWSVIIGGILQAVNIEGFLDDTMKQIKEIDPKLEQAADMARPWFEKHGSAWLLVKDAVEFAVTAGYVKEDDKTQTKTQTTASALRKLRMVKLPGGYRFEKDDDFNRGSLWRVVKDAGSVS